MPPLEIGLTYQPDNPMYAQDALTPVRLFILQNYRPQGTIGDWKVYERIAASDHQLERSRG